MEQRSPHTPSKALGFDTPTDAVEFGVVGKVLTPFNFPLMKRWNNGIANQIFFLFLVYYAFLPLCGPVGFSYKVLVTWMGSFALQEALQLFRCASIALSDPFTFVDLFNCLCLGFACRLRYRLSQQDMLAEQPWLYGWDYVKQIDWERRQAGKEPLRPPDGLREQPGLLYLDQTGSMQCAWTGELEAIRTLLALSIIFSALRLFEHISFDQRLARVWFTLCAPQSHPCPRWRCQRLHAPWSSMLTVDSLSTWQYSNLPK